ncbi:hypothetical protein AYI69_g3307 [Smittium culicis]|uniref:Uncharacterized protein n=1 Tax=Smittium culicis TaxID=133412 RepID=A0A1R1YK48_9FUNG|nr:hypothetical protein AYI69_g3307 [Smittium culicis]
MARSNNGANRTTRSRTTATSSTSSTTAATSSSANPGSAPTARTRRPTGENDLISDPVPHYSAASIDPPVIEIADNDSSDQSNAPPSYSLLHPQTNYPTIPQTTFDSAHTPVASSSRSQAPLSVTTLVPSLISNRNFISNGKGRASNTHKMVRYSSPLTTASTVRRTNGAIQRPSTNTSVRANFGSLNRSSSEFRTHLAAASNCRSYTPYDHSKKLKAIEELTGIRNTSVNPFDLVVLKGIRRKQITEVKKYFIDLDVYIDMIGKIKFVDDRTEILEIKS